MYSKAAATEFFYYCLLTVNYVLGILYVFTQFVSTRGLGSMPCCHPIVELSGQSQKCSEDHL